MLKPTKHATTNYKALAPFLETVDASEEQHVTFTASGYMPLSIEKLYSDNGLPVYGMMHWTTQNGDLMRDPDMTFRVDHTAGTVEPLTFQNDFMGMYQEVYTDGGNRYRPRLRTDLDKFLWQWLKNIKDQQFDPGQKPAPDPEPDPAPKQNEPSTAPDGQALFFSA